MRKCTISYDRNPIKEKDKKTSNITKPILFKFKKMQNGQPKFVCTNCVNNQNEKCEILFDKTQVESNIHNRFKCKSPVTRSFVL